MDAPSDFGDRDDFTGQEELTSLLAHLGRVPGHGWSLILRSNRTREPGPCGIDVMEPEPSRSEAPSHRCARVDLLDGEAPVLSRCHASPRPSFRYTPATVQRSRRSRLGRSPSGTPFARA